MTISNSKTSEQKIFFEQIKVLYRSKLLVLVVGLVVSTTFVYGLWGIMSQTKLMIWYAIVLVIFAARILAYIFYQNRFTIENAKLYARLYVIGSGLNGTVWGIGSIVFFPVQGVEYQLFILFVVAGMGSGAVSSLTSYMPAFLAYFPISLAPITIQLILVGEPIQLSLGIMTVAYLIAMSYLGLNIYRTLIESLRLRFENVELIEKLREQKDEAEQANYSKTKFLAAASHDLRQPLHALTLFTSALDESIKYPKVRRIVDQINTSVQTLQNLFDALLDITRLEAGVMKVEKINFHLTSMLKNLANEYNPQAKTKMLNIVWSEEPFAIYTDPTLFELILRNYISNALRYTDEGEINISCRDSGDNKLTISVSDTGTGIPESDWQTIFQEFRQLGNPKQNRNRGLGLGLAIVKHTAKLLDHTINISSEEGKGSVFSVTVDKADLESDSIGSETMLVNNNVNNTRKLLILVIDDEVAIREGMVTLLSIWGCDVIGAADKGELMAKLTQLDRIPDGIIADYRLDVDLTGVDIIHAVHSYYDQAIPAIIITGDIAIEHLDKVKKSQLQILSKPVPTPKLRTFLRHIQLNSA